MGGLRFLGENISMARWLPILAICLFIAYQRGLLRLPMGSHASPLAVQAVYTLADAHSLSCKAPERTKCLVVYTAPWCGACKQFLTELFPTLLKGMQAYPHAGLEVIVGADKPSAIKTMGMALGMPYISDPEQKLFSALGMRAFPSFAGLDKQGKLLEVADGFRAQGSTQEEAIGNFIKGLLKE